MKRVTQIVQHKITSQAGKGLVSNGEFRMQIGNENTWICMCHYFIYESGKGGNREYTEE